MRRLAAAITITAALAGTAACSSSDGDKNDPAPAAAGSADTGSAPGQRELEDAVRAYSDAFLGGQGEQAYTMFSKRCQGREDRAAFTRMTEQARQLYGQLPITTLAVDRIEGTMARVTYRFAVSVLDQVSEPWVVEDGRWRQDDC